MASVSVVLLLETRKTHPRLSEGSGWITVHKIQDVFWSQKVQRVVAQEYPLTHRTPVDGDGSSSLVLAVAPAHSITASVQLFLSVIIFAHCCNCGLTELFIYLFSYFFNVLVLKIFSYFSPALLIWEWLWKNCFDIFKLSPWRTHQVKCLVFCFKFDGGVKVVCPSLGLIFHQGYNSLWLSSEETKTIAGEGGGQ